MTRLRRLAPIVAALVAVTARGADLSSFIDAVKPSLVVVGHDRATDTPRFTAHGAGFVVGDGRLVVTNAHVVADGGASGPESRLTVQVRAATRGDARAALEARGATVLEVDAPHDLALLRIDGAPLPALALRAATGVVREGRSVAWMGFPLGGLLGFAPVTQRGIVSSIAPVALPRPGSRAESDEGFEVFQLDAVAYAGNSGGPLFAVDSGEVLGVVDVVPVRAPRESAFVQPVAIGYAIPVRHVVELLRRHAAPR